MFALTANMNKRDKLIMDIEDEDQKDEDLKMKMKI